jgi:hypothetical protein
MCEFVEQSCMVTRAMGKGEKRRLVHPPTWPHLLPPPHWSVNDNPHTSQPVRPSSPLVSLDSTLATATLPHTVGSTWPNLSIDSCCAAMRPPASGSLAMRSYCGLSPTGPLTAAQQACRPQACRRASSTAAMISSATPAAAPSAAPTIAGVDKPRARPEEACTFACACACRGR